jgi:hypothetical protein
VTVPSRPAPPELSAPAVVGTDVYLSGTGAPGATVTVRLSTSGDILGRAEVRTDGRWQLEAVDLRSHSGAAVEATQRSRLTSRVSVPVKLPAFQLLPPTVTAQLVDDRFLVSGTADPLASVTVHITEGSELGTVTADAKGAWTVLLEVAGTTNGATVVAVQRAEDGFSSSSVPYRMPVIELAPPKIGDVDLITQDRRIMIEVEGTATPGTTVVVTWPNGTSIGTAVAGSDGRWRIVSPFRVLQWRTTMVAVERLGSLESGASTYWVGIP